jgi:hypothetical protein
MTAPVLDRSNVHLHAMPAALGDTRLWRLTVVWHEITHWERIDVGDIAAKAGFIREFASKVGIAWEHLIWLDSEIDREVNEWISRNQENEILQRQVLLLLTRLNDQEKMLANMDEALKVTEKRLDRIAAFCQVLKEERKTNRVENATKDSAGVGTRPRTAD